MVTTKYARQVKQKNHGVIAPARGKARRCDQEKRLAAETADILPDTLPPIPRHHELATPHSPPSGLRRLLLAHIRFGVAPVRERPALFDHPCAEIIATGKADSDYSPVAIEIPLLTAHDLAADKIGQDQRRLVST
jgi:hypothetical protein